jgi:hypothetical protein
MKARSLVPTLLLLTSLSTPAVAARGYVIRGGSAVRRVAVAKPAPVVVTRVVNPTPVIVQVDPVAAAKAQKDRDAKLSAIDQAEKQRNERALVGADERVAAFLKQRTADGSADAPFDLAHRHETGKGVPVNESEARRLYGIAAGRGNRDAQNWLQEHPQAPSPTVAPGAVGR